MMSNDDAIHEIKNRFPLEQYVQKFVQLKHTGNRWVGLCPFHQEKSPSFTVNENAGFFHCFGCQSSGDLFTFYQQYHSVDFRTALETLAEEAGVALHVKKMSSPTLKKQRLYSMYSIAQEHFKKNLSASAHLCKEYLENRNISEESITSFGLGYSTDSWDSLTTTLKRANYSLEEIKHSGLVSIKENHVFDKFRNRLMFPIFSLAGEVLAFGGRVLPSTDATMLTEQAKYMNSPESPIYTKGQHLYGLPQARKAIATEKYIMITEGYLDTITLHQYMYKTAVAILGTALTAEHAKRITSLTSCVEIVLDADTAGKSATLRSTELLLQQGLKVRVVILPDGEDIDSFLHKHGQDAFEDLRKKAFGGLEYCRTAIIGLSPKEIAEWVHTFLGKIENIDLAEQYQSKLKAWVNIDEQILPNKKRNLGKKSFSVPVPISSNGEQTIEKEIMIVKHLIHYPHNCILLRNAGIDIALQSKEIKEIIQYMYTHDTLHDILSVLSENARKIFSLANVDIEANIEKEQEELQDILLYLEKEYKKRSMASMKTLMNTSDDIATLSAMQTILQGNFHE